MQETDRLFAGGDGSVHEKLTTAERIPIARAWHTSGRRIEAALALGTGAHHHAQDLWNWP